MSTVPERFIFFGDLPAISVRAIQVFLRFGFEQRLAVSSLLELFRTVKLRLLGLPLRARTF